MSFKSFRWRKITSKNRWRHTTGTCFLTYKSLSEPQQNSRLTFFPLSTKTWDRRNDCNWFSQATGQISATSLSCIALSETNSSQSSSTSSTWGTQVASHSPSWPAGTRARSWKISKPRIINLHWTQSSPLEFSLVSICPERSNSPQCKTVAVFRSQRRRQRPWVRIRSARS